MDREETTPPSGSIQQLEAKRQRFDPQVEEEISEEVIESPRRERETSQQTPTSSFQQERERGSMVWRFLLQGSKASNRLALKELSWKSRPKMSC